MKIRISIVIVGVCAVLGWPASLLAEAQQSSPEPPVVQNFDWLPGGEEELSRVKPGQEPPGQEPYYVTMQVKFECLLFDGDCSQFQILRPPAGQELFDREVKPLFRFKHDLEGDFSFFTRIFIRIWCFSHWRENNW